MAGAPYFRALDRQKLVAGCERRAFAYLVSVTIFPAYFGWHAIGAGAWLHGGIGVAVGTAGLLGGIAWLRKLARKDPMLVRLFLRNRRYARAYSANSGLWTRARKA